MAVLEVEGLCKFLRGLRVICELGFGVEEGEFR